MAAQAPEAIALKEEFEHALAKVEEAMEGRNAQAASRARHAPAGVPYTLLYPSTDTYPVTPDNKGMTGRGIPCVARTCAVPPACLSSAAEPALIAWRPPCQCTNFRACRYRAG